jgi:ribosomal protein S18 acetylase RimI-like enzyme
MPTYDPVIGYIPGLIGRVAELHATYYALHWNFGRFFEAKVASELASFITRYDESRDRIWSLGENGVIEGSITIDGTPERGSLAHLRWFIVSDRLRGKGAGNYLMAQAMAFCRNAGYDRAYLSTFQGLAPARHLYEKFGFKLVEEHPGNQWGKLVTEQRFEMAFSP